MVSNITALLCYSDSERRGNNNDDDDDDDNNSSQSDLGRAYHYPHVREFTVPLRVRAVANVQCVTKRYGSVTERYGTLRERYGALQNVTERCGRNGTVTENINFAHH